MNKVFDFERIVFLIRKDLLQVWRGILAPTGVSMGILILGNILFVLFKTPNPDSSFFDLVRTLLFVMGFIATSMAFAEIHDKNRCEDYILLPASTIEKTFARLFLVSIILPLYIISIVLVSSFISETVNAWAFRDPIAVFNPFNAKMGKTMLAFFLIQQAVFLGAAWFKKAHLVKTILTCLALFLMFCLLAFLTVRIMFFNSGGIPWDGWLMETRICSYLESLLVIGKVLSYGLLVPFCWVLAWMRVREVQSHHGI